ncbi:MAG: hypothetical protein R3D03_23665 [Geminicoccaceae bacterium]
MPDVVAKPPFLCARNMTVIIMLAVMGMLLAQGVPRLRAELSKVVSRQPLSLVLSGEFPTDAGFDRIIRSHSRALRLMDDPVTSRELGLAYLSWSFVDLAEGDDASVNATRAKEYVSRSLHQVPADGYAWYLRAQSAIVLGDVDQATAALARSYRIVPFDFGNAATRLSVSLQLIDDLDIQTVELVAAEVTMLATENVRALASTALAVGRPDEVLAILRVSDVGFDVITTYIDTVRRLMETTF